MLVGVLTDEVKKKRYSIKLRARGVHDLSTLV